MVDFKNIKPKVVVTPKLTLKLEIDFLESALTCAEAAQRLQFLIDSSRSEAISAFIVTMLRETRSSMWELKSLEIN